jgi:DNA mismatch repair protein MutL
VNSRAIKNPSLTHALYGAYGDMLMRDRHPVAFVFIDIDPAFVDVNVHPAKAEVRFRNQAQIHDLVRDVIREALRGSSVSPVASHDEGVRESLSAYLERVESPETSASSVEPFGVRSSEFRNTISSSIAPGQNQQIDYCSAPGPTCFHSELPTPNSELYYPLAQIHDSFIIAQSQEGMAIIDQHAAHERVLFERLQDQLQTDDIPVQTLLMPVQVELGPAQGGLLAEHLPELSRLGFMVEDFGNNTFIIKAVPALLTGADYKKLLLDILDEVNVHGASGRMDKPLNDLLSVMACHPAIKVHRHLEQREMETLLHDLFQCRMPHTCPHGRPTVIRYSMGEINKIFKRI